MISNIKDKLLLFLGAFIGFLMLWIQQMRVGRANLELRRAKTARKLQDKANTAIITGLEEEAKPVTKRGYFDKYNKDGL